ncbi:MAG: glutaredoxin [Paucimonas sp.]|jgi:hypothetical protein|nr:glutaredoxin [Paucimonas sp.]
MKRQPTGCRFCFQPMSEIRFTLYSRSYCHLCDDMLAALDAYRELVRFSVEVRDVDQDEQLVAKYDELVPVLVGHDADREIEICHYFLDHGKVRVFLGIS